MDGCHGGDAGVANKWMAENGITDETCSIYQARGHDNGAPCSRVSRCETCWPETGCYRPENYHTYWVEEYGDVEGDDQESYNKFNGTQNTGCLSYLFPLGFWCF